MHYKTTPIYPFGILIEPTEKPSRIGDLEIAHLRNLLRREHLIVLRGFQTFNNPEGFADYSEGWGEISIWPFGKVLELIEQDNPDDHIFDNSYIPLHWDGMYRPEVPELQIFHCVSAPLPGQGGRTTFSNTMMALDYATQETKDIWHKVTGIYKRKMEFYNSKTTSPIITKHPFRDFSVIRYNEPPSKFMPNFINPPDLEFVGINQDTIESFHQGIQKALYDARNFYAHEWQSGDIVIADNFSLLHGRENFTSKSPRHLQRIHILSNPPLNNSGLESYNE